MNAPLIARIIGSLFVLAGIAGFLPWIAPPAPFEAPVVTLDTFYRLVGGVFPVNLAHDVVHLLFGIWGILAAFQFRNAVIYLRSVTWIYLVLTIMGLVPITNTLFGIAPLYGWDIALHFVFVVLAAWGGYGSPARNDVLEPA
jgi:hypothetical protein